MCFLSSEPVTLYICTYVHTHGTSLHFTVINSVCIRMGFNLHNGDSRLCWEISNFLNLLVR